MIAQPGTGREGPARKARPRIPLWRWTLWWVLLALGMFVFYVALTPIWVGLRVLAWTAEFRARRRRPAA